jgi:mannose-6-phosphate isomerase-like protein (cupin superfamily)
MKTKTSSLMDGYMNNLNQNNMKATLEYNLPEDREDFNHATNGFNYYMALVEMDEWLRSEYKYNGREELYEVREMLREIILDNNVKID